MTMYEMYGWHSMPLEQGAELLAAATGVTFALHDSFYLGGDYYRAAGPDGGRMTVQDNFEDEDGCLKEPDFPEHRTLVYISGREAWGSEWNLDIEGLELLRVDTID